MASNFPYKLVVIACVFVIIFTALLLNQTMGNEPINDVKNQGGQLLYNRHSNHDKDTPGYEDIIQLPQSLLNKLDTQYPSNYGKPILGKDIVVVYNRVPKCGSRTMLALATTMGQRNGYKRPRPIITPSNLNEYGIVKRNIATIQPPAYLEGHVFFVDTPSDRKYVFINFIRDPLDRMVSQYYFTRFGDDKFTDIEKLHKRTKPKFTNETFDDCVIRNRSGCVGDFSLSQQLRHFCGYHPKCRSPSQWAVEEAKRNMDKFLLVGITERYDETLQLLEQLLPDFFKGLFAEYGKPTMNDMTTRTKSKNKVAPSPIVAKTMKEKLKYEYEVYNHAVNKFNWLQRYVFD